MSERSHDIEKYLRGEMSPAEMHALEKRALDDPFLADALEGASQFQNNELSADLQSLQKALNERVEEKKVISLWGWTMRIAAGLILVVVSTVVIININKDPESKNVAMTEKEDVDTLQSSAGTPNAAASQGDTSHASERDLLALDQKAKDEERAENKPKTAARESTQPGEQIASATQPAGQQVVVSDNASELKIDTIGTLSEIADASPIIEAEKPEGLDADDSQVAKEDVSKRKSTIAGAPPTRPEAASTRAGETAATPSVSAVDKRAGVALTKVTGRVTAAEDGTGLPGVNVVIKGTSTGTVTDINGNYEIEVPDPYGTLVYSFIGLESMEMPVNNTTIIDAAMQQDVAQLSEVVVTGFGEVDNSGPTYSTFQMAEPLGGRRAFKKYLEDKLIYPQQAIANNVEGKVTVQFIVETTGKLTDFSVVKGIGYGCDEELIRLIKQGPKWSATKRDDELVKSRVRVRIRFTLPKKK